MLPIITAFRNSPDRGQGQARDMRVRWALEEVRQPYAVRLVSFEEMKAPAHRALHPFGKIPTFEQGNITLFESGAILLHIAEQHPALLPREAAARGRAIAWLFAAVNTMEPPIVEIEAASLIETDKPWYEARQRLLEERARERLGELSTRLGEQHWLDVDFTIGDLMMVTVLDRLNGTGLLEEYPNLFAYVRRGKARPAFQRAFDAQYQVFVKSQQG